MIKLVLLRHGESTWNKENLFTGWTDVDLSEKGLEEAHEAGRLLKAEGFTFDLAYTSRPQAGDPHAVDRARRDGPDVDAGHQDTWRLNERHYGALQGLNKAETAEKYGEKQVKLWRRSYDVPPPSLTRDDPRWPGHDPRYADVAPDELPLAECLKDTVARFLPWWHAEAVPDAQVGQARDYCGARQQPARPGQVPGQHLR